ncbi:MAG: NAD(P)H-dependent oxidoreductase subunit E [Anaerolineaceae bacterium]|nr:NAD(P)H-dependent oxidoreductase subunit E [Anaerolineaceae bacterium]
MTENQSPTCCGEESKRLFADLDAFIDELKINPTDPERREMLISTLHKAQSIFGYLPEIVQKHVAHKFFIPHADVSGVISFYNFFTTKPKGKTNINVCMGTACYVNGADKILADFEQALGIKAGEVTEDGRFSIECLRCVGACGLAPVVMINDKVFGKVKQGDAHSILEQYIVEESGEHLEVK